MGGGRNYKKLFYVILETVKVGVMEGDAVFML